MKNRNTTIHLKQDSSSLLKVLKNGLTKSSNSNSLSYDSEYQSGSALTILISTIACFFLYVKYLNAYVAVNLHGLFAAILMVILGIACMFAFFNFLTSFIGGFKSNSSVKKEIAKELELYNQIIADSEAELRVIEKGLSDNRIAISKNGLDSISLVRKIIAALKERDDNVSSLLATKSDLAFVQAVETMNSNLLIKENSFFTTVSHNLDHEWNELDPVKILPTIRNLFDDINLDVQSMSSRASVSLKRDFIKDY